ncbi:MAG TPA: SDR family NAD(P)-dependent oxidoreductase [Blastocatellia bacterium]|nr:SDR family NAD(P)-dependent oxidoreductase [Blastocatellia bacterium]
MNFTNQIVLVTGTARGIGRAIAQLFAQHGATVALHYHSNRTDAERTLASLPGTDHALFQADLTKPEATQTLVETIVARYGRLNVLVNNAGIYQDHPIASVSFADWQAAWRATIDTNLIGTANLMYWAAQQMMRQGGGRIVNISSRGAFRGEPTAPAYGASKAALNAMSQSLAQALAPHQVFVYVVAPGFVETERVAYKLSDDIRNQSPLKRVAHPDEVARTVLFLASEGTDFLTGCIVDVNGASYLRS